MQRLVLLCYSLSLDHIWEMGLCALPTGIDFLLSTSLHKIPVSTPFHVKRKISVHSIAEGLCTQGEQLYPLHTHTHCSCVALALETVPFGAVRGHRVGRLCHVPPVRAVTCPCGKLPLSLRGGGGGIPPPSISYTTVSVNNRHFLFCIDRT